MEYYVTVKNNITGDVKTWTLEVPDSVTSVTQYIEQEFSEGLLDFDIIMIEGRF